LELLTPTETPTPNIIPVQPSPLPTNTLLPTQAPAPSDSGNSSVTDENRIQFPSGSTWVEVGTHLNEGDTIEYVLSAMKGQVMSLSIEQDWPFTVEVETSTTVLSDPNGQHPFWRGTLPVTGDYFITVKTRTSGNFTLRVAINPPGQTYHYFDYESLQRTATLRYPDEFAPTSSYPTGQFKGGPTFVLQFIRPEFYYPSTNLSEAYFIYSELFDPQSVDTCTQPLPRPETVQGQKMINGYNFTYSESVDVAAGNIFDQVIYRTVYNNICFEMVFYMHSGNIGNYTPGTVVEFDRASLVQKFEAVLSTFTVK
jgi:hypothetical protein